MNTSVSFQYKVFTMINIDILWNGNWYVLSYSISDLVLKKCYSDYSLTSLLTNIPPVLSETLWPQFDTSLVSTLKHISKQIMFCRLRFVVFKPSETKTVVKYIFTIAESCHPFSLVAWNDNTSWKSVVGKVNLDVLNG